MGIQALPNTTVRALGASQVLNDPASVVKELIDNAIDARATSISIEIANNTVDSIQVRDNGHGIPPEDRQLVAKPHCTSKITCEDDLNAIGGTSLGFRGEAIASIAGMSSSLTISTRVEGEQVAAALKINKQGDLVGQEKASLPVGTTVKITGFVKDYPVRNQNALKNSEKCLRAIKQMLKSYAFARQQVRLSLRVLKAKTDKVNWTYAPKIGGNAEESAFKIVGSACASQCLWSVLEDQGFTVQAFLPKIDADSSKVSNIGAFISVDGRPVSTLRGSPKQIAKMFREALKKADTKFDGIKEPFLFLEIACPASSYDANVEPAKDDVLFENPDGLIDLTRRLFDAAYPAKAIPFERESTPDPVVNGTPLQAPNPEEDDFVTSLEPGYHHDSDSRSFAKPTLGLIPDRIMNELTDTYHDDISDNEQAPSQHTFRPNMYGCDEEDMELLNARPPTGRTEAESEEIRQAHRDITVSNPFVLAKLNAAARRSLHSQYDDSTQNGACHLPTPRPSSPSLSTQGLRGSQPTSTIQHENDGRSIGARGLPAPHGMIAPPSPARNEGTAVLAAAVGGPSAPPEYDYTLSSQLDDSPRGTPLHAVPSSDQRPRRRQPKLQQSTNVNKPFKPPSVDHPPREKVWFDHLENDDRGMRRQGKRRNVQRHFASDGLVQQGELGDLVEDPQPLTPPRRNRDMRDFVTQLDLTEDDSVASLIEARHYPQRRRSLSEAEFMPAADLAEPDNVYTSKQTQHSTKRRRTSEARAMREISGNARACNNDDEEFRPTTGARALSRRRLSTRNGNKSRRLKSSLLPLERVPLGQAVHNVVSTQTTTTHEISRLQPCVDLRKSWSAWNEKGDDLYDAFDDIEADEIQGLALNLEKVLISRVSDGEMVRDLCVLVEHALNEHNTES